MQHLYELLADIAASHESPLSTAISAKIRKRDWLGLKELSIDPESLSPELYWSLSQCRGLLLKAEGLEGMPSKADLDSKCVKEFFRCEAKNYESNRRIGNLFEFKGFETPESQRLRDFFADVKREIRSVLGNLPNIDRLRTRFGPGSTYCLPAPFNTFADKLVNVPSYTIDSWPFILDWMGTAWSKCANRVSDTVYPDGPLGPSREVGYGLIPERVRGNRFTTVDKDSFKRRGICVEPALNVFYQLGYGSYIRERLKSQWGIDLIMGQERHRSSAQRGSCKSTGLMTLDLSSASDLIPYALVRHLLPRNWFHVLDSLRSPYTRINGKWVRLEKFSSMGNGYTFELETLIFHSLVRVIARKSGIDVDQAVRDGDILQYGDDCIAPSSISEDIISVFRWCGFEVNTSKSYTSGVFRESCGGDFHSGVDVRIAKLKKLPSAPEEWISFANSLWSVIGPTRDPSRSASWRRLHRWALSNIPTRIRRLRGPEYLGDQVIHSHPADWQSNCYQRDGIDYYWGYLPVANHIPLGGYPPHAALGAALMGYTSNGPVNPAAPISGYRVRLIGKPKDLRVRLTRPAVERRSAP